MKFNLFVQSFLPILIWMHYFFVAQQIVLLLLLSLLAALAQQLTVNTCCINIKPIFNSANQVCPFPPVQRNECKFLMEIMET